MSQHCHPALPAIRRFDELSCGQLPSEAERSQALAKWLSLSHSDLEGARSALSKTVGARINPYLKPAVHMLTVIVCGLLAYVRLFPILANPGSPGAHAVFDLTLCFIVIVAIVLTGDLYAFVSELRVFREPLYLGELLLPASDEEDSDDALKAIAAHTELMMYRDRVVASGRSLTGLDLEYILYRARDLDAIARQASRRDVHRELHQLSANATDLQPA